MIKQYVIAACLICCSCSCAVTVPEAIEIRSLKQYSSLNKQERGMAEEIMRRAVRSDREKYYFERLKLLISTETVPKSTIAEMNIARFDESARIVKHNKDVMAKKSGVGVEEYINAEEIYEASKERIWEKYCPNKFSNPACFYVADKDPTDVLVHIQVHLKGNFELVKEELEFEDSIEKHLSIPGFNVNLVFVGHSGDDVFEVNIEPKEWSTNENWAGGALTSAHELMHLMGLPDEYDRIESHAANKYMPVAERLGQFLIQMSDTQPIDAKDGIMCDSNKRPLQRHVCMAVGLGEECVKARKEKFK